MGLDIYKYKLITKDELKELSEEERQDREFYLDAFTDFNDEEKISVIEEFKERYKNDIFEKEVELFDFPQMYKDNILKEEVS